MEDSNSVGTKLPSWIPSASNILDVCNDVFKQAGISFTVHSSSGARNYPYDTRGFVDLEPAFPGMMMSYNTNAHPRAADNSMSWQEYSAFFSTYNIAGYTPAVESICECFALSNTVGMAIINKGTMGYEGPYPSDDTPPYIRGTKSGVVFAGNVR